LQLSKEDLLHTLELVVRTKMIQLREDYLSKSPQQCIDEILYFMPVIREGVLYLKNIENTAQKDLISAVDKHFKCD